MCARCAIGKAFAHLKSVRVTPAVYPPQKLLVLYCRGHFEPLIAVSIVWWVTPIVSVL